MLSKKYYIEFAKIFSKRKVDRLIDEIYIGKSIMRENIKDDFINLFKSDNPNFNIDKFNKACDK